MIRRRLCLVALSALLAGCASTDEESGWFSDLDIPWIGDDAESMSGETKELIVPPDLDNVDLQGDFHGAGRVVSAKSKNRSYVLPQNLRLRIYREGGVAWLVADADPASIWPEVERFWRDRGFRLEESNPKQGFAITNWRTRLGRGGEAAYSDVRDRFITRLSREPNGHTNIYIVNRRSGGDVASDSEAELAMLEGFQEYLATAKWAIDSRVGSVRDKRVRMDIRNARGVPLLEIGEGYSEVWRRMVLVLQRTGLVVRDSDRSRGLFLVSVAEPSPEATFAGRMDAGELFELHLFPKGRVTAVTAHAYESGGRLEYDEAYELLRRVLNGYYVGERQIL